MTEAQSAVVVICSVATTLMVSFLVFVSATLGDKDE